MLKKLEENLQVHETEECPRYAVRSGEVPFLLEKDMLFPAKEKEFQGLSVMVPGQICQYLIEWYGDEWSCFSDYEKPESQEMAEVEGLSDQEFRKVICQVSARESF